MLPQYLQKHITLRLTTIEPETPIAGGQLLPISNYGLGIFDQYFMTSQEGMVSNFLQADYTPWRKAYNAGTTNYVPEHIEKMFRQSIYNNQVSYNSWNIAKAEHHDINFFTMSTDSARQGFDMFIENAAVYGIPADNVPGLIYNSGIPQAIDANNYFNGSMTGEAMVDGILRWVNYVWESTNYRYKSKVMGIPPKLVTALVNTKYQNLQNESAMTVLRQRMAERNSIQMIEVPSLEYARTMVLLPDDAEMIGLGVNDLIQRNENGQLEFLGGTLGVVAIRPESGLVIRLSGL